MDEGTGTTWGWQAVEPDDEADGYILKVRPEGGETVTIYSPDGSIPAGTLPLGTTYWIEATEVRTGIRNAYRMTPDLPRPPEPTATPTLTDFLLARIAEDEAACGPEDEDHGIAWCDADEGAHYRAVRVLAECEAKRRIVERCGDVDYARPSTHLAHGVLALLALPYADHPDYRQEWRP